MESIFHEKQQGSLCAQHCLNALLQGSYFTPVDLAELAKNMDNEERLRMAESGLESDDYVLFMQQPSSNMDDSGYFSVQVLSAALNVWGLELVPYNSTEELAVQAHEFPESMTAYICNYRDHWLTIRKIGYQWFNLNSLLNSPELISDTYLHLYLAQLLQEGYSIFIIKGSLPHCKADELLKIKRAVPVPKESLVKPTKVFSSEEELNKAIRLSMGEEVDQEEEELHRAIKQSIEEDTDPALAKALEMSLELTNNAETSNDVADPAELRRLRLAYLDNKSRGSINST